MLYFSVLAFFLNMNFFSEMVLCCDRLCKSPDECLLQLCNEECIPKWKPCNNSCSDARYLFFNGRCMEKAKVQLWECNGKLQSWSVPCNGTCHEMGTISKDNHNELLQSNVDYNKNKIILKCRDKDICISSEVLCSRDVTDIGETHKSCGEDLLNSRRICDNLDKLGYDLNCPRQGMLQCPGKKTWQCVNKWKICDGTYDCIDRYFPEVVHLLITV